MPATDAVALARRLLAALPGKRDEAVAVLNGLLGDRLESASSPLAIGLSLSRGPGQAPLNILPGLLEGAEPRACILVHGLMGSERAWSFGVSGGSRVEYGRALAEARGVTPIYARYNTGRHVSSNGRELADHLEQLVDAWPDLQELSIVGHSMGGLVTRSACHYALEADHRWVRRLQRVFLLGVPSHGASLEQLVHVAAFTLEAIWNPWTKVIGKIINMRSEGIKDLRHGFVLDEDWRNRDPDQLALRRPRSPSIPPGVRWYVAAGALGEERSRLGWLFGDGLVHARSARGRGFGTPRPGLLPDAELRVFQHTSHMALMNDPRVLDQMLEWWAAEPDEA